MTLAIPSALQARPHESLLARMIAAIYGIIDALVPVIETIENTQTRPWVERTRFGDRFWAIIRELIALTIRIEPESLAENPTFPPLRPRAPRPAPANPRPRARFPKTTLSPRQLAKRLATLLHKLICLAAEAQAALTPDFHHQATQLRTLAGCDRLPPQSWETSG